MPYDDIMTGGEASIWHGYRKDVILADGWRRENGEDGEILYCGPSKCYHGWYPSTAVAGYEN